MIESVPVRSVLLKNGITLHFYDRSNRYYGDFHRVLVAVEGVVGLDAVHLADEMKSAVAELPDSLLYRRDLERMGVTSASLPAIVSALIDDFLDSTRDYLARPDIPEQLLKKRLAAKGKRRLSLLQG